MRTVIFLGFTLLASATGEIKGMTDYAINFLAVVLGVVILMDIIEFFYKLWGGK